MKTRHSDNQQTIPSRVKEAVLALNPEAEVILFGSQARGNSHEESDWDFLILVSKQVNRFLKKEVRDALWEIEVKEDTLINSLIISRKMWLTRKGWPIYDNVDNEGIAI